MNNANTLYIYINKAETEPRLIVDATTEFLLVLVFSDKLSQETISGVVHLYDDQDIIVDKTMVVSGRTSLEMLRGFAHKNHVVETHNRLAIWLPGTKGQVSTMNRLFDAATRNGWEYCHPALRQAKGLKSLAFVDQSYPEYQRKSLCITYSYAPYLPLVSPVYSHRIFDVIKQTIKAYDYESEQTFCEHWIPEALSRQEQLTHPVIVRSSVVDVSDFSINQKDNDQDAYEACFRVVRDLYPLEGEIEVLCISLDEDQSQWRKNQFTNSANSFGVDFNWFAAVDGRQWKPDDYPAMIAHRGRRIDWHEPLTGGEIGVAASHKAVWQASWDSKSEGVIIFEDDAVICQSLDVLQIPLDADILMLNNRAIHNQKGEIVEGACGTDAYVITRRGIYKMLQIMEHVNMPLDFMIVTHSKSVVQGRTAASMLHNPLNHQLKTYHHLIFATHNDRGESTIGHSS